MYNKRKRVTFLFIIILKIMMTYIDGDDDGDRNVCVDDGSMVILIKI